MTDENLFGPRQRQNSAVLAARLTKELLDSDLMQKYGTSIDINMGRNFQKYLDKKYHILENEFKKIDKNQDDIINLEELTEFINSYSNETGRIYDIGYSKNLFSIIDKDHDEKLTIQEFIEAYIKLEQKIRLKKITLSKRQDDLQKDLSKYKKGMNENKDEIINKDGLSTTATLNISLYNAIDLKPLDLKGTSSPYCIFILDGKKEISSFKPDTLDPIWNEFFSIAVTKKNLILTIEVHCHNSFGGQDIHGTVTIPLVELESQQKIDQDFNLYLEGDSESNGKISLRLQYLYSKYKYYVDNHNKTEKEISILEENIMLINKYIELIEKPYGILLSGEINNIIDRRLLDKPEEFYENRRSSIRKSVWAGKNSPKGGITTMLASRFQMAVKGISEKTQFEWSKLSLAMMYTIFVCSFICLIERSDFVGLSVSVSIWIIFILEKKIEIFEYLKKILYTIMGSATYDLLWLYLHYKTFMLGSSLDNREKTLKMLTYIIAVINYLSKIVLLVTLFMHYTKAKTISDRTKDKNNFTSNNSANIMIGEQYQK